METIVGLTRFKLNQSKTTYIKCNFSTNDITRDTILVEEKEIALSGFFKYFGPYFRVVRTSNTT